MDDESTMQESGTAAWVVTFADLVILMLTFFVLLFSMTTMKTETWQAFSGAFSRTLQVDPGQPVNERSAEYNIAARPVPTAMNLTYLSAVLEETLAGDPLLSQARLAQDADRLLLSLPADLLFGPGGAALEGPGEAAMASLGGVLGSLDNRITVAGHAAPEEDLGSGAGGFTSAWELSLARAAAVANALSRAGYVGTAEVMGHGASRQPGVSASASETARAALARRVDIVIHEGGRGR